MLNAGKFAARPTGAELGTTNKGTEQIGIAFDLLDGPDAGQTITAYRYFSDAAFQYALKDMRTCGFTGDDVGNLSSIGADPDLIVQLVIEHESYTNPETNETKVSAKVKWINAANSGGVQMSAVMGAGQRASFAQRMKQKVRAFDASEAQAAKSSGAKSAPARPTTRPAALPPQRPHPHDADDFGPPPPGFDE